MAFPKCRRYSIGCDCCGMYPIVGPRWRCTDCPEEIGFDLCSACHSLGPAEVHGRFNQRHTAAHRMQLVEPKRGLLHLLMDLHPELTVDQLRHLLELAFTDDDPPAANLEPLEHHAAPPEESGEQDPGEGQGAA